MDIGRGISRYFDALSNARTALHPAVLWPFALFALLQLLILLAMGMFTSPLLAPVMVPVLRFLGGEQSLHYPLHLVELPSVYQRVYLPLVATVGFVLWTLAVWKLVDRHAVGREGPRRPFGRFLPQTILLGILFVGASLVVSESFSRLVNPKTPATLVRAILLASVAVTALAQTFLIYAPVALRLRGGNAWSSIRAGARYAAGHFLATTLVILTVLVVHLPLDFLLSRADRVAARFHPETVWQLMAASVALEMITAYVLFAGITELALPREGGLR
jgi:hypothetical protein